MTYAPEELKLLEFLKWKGLTRATLREAFEVEGFSDLGEKLNERVWTLRGEYRVPTDVRRMTSQLGPRRYREMVRVAASGRLDEIMTRAKGGWPPPSQLTPEEIQEKAIELDQLILAYPFDVTKTYFWKVWQRHGIVPCCCCCCCGGGHRPQPGLSLKPPQPTAPKISVTLSGTARVLVVGSTVTGRVELEWIASGASGIRVDLEARSAQQHMGYNWTKIVNLQNQDPIDRGIWWGTSYPGPGMVPGQRYEARAVARRGRTRVYSNVLTF